MAAPALARAIPDGPHIRISLATEQDREAIYRLRHAVYARELHQHAENTQGQLSDSLDAYNWYLVAALGEEIVGFVSVTPPGRAYSIDKYLSRQDLPFPCDCGLYEVRLLTVASTFRHSVRGAELAGLLIYAAFRWIDDRGGRRVVAIGRRELLGLYKKIGFQSLGREIHSGAVTFELMTTTLEDARRRLRCYRPLLRYVESNVDWQLPIPYLPPTGCAHGGAFFRAVGEDFDHLERRHSIINADVLDAWFLPAPSAVAALEEHLAWLAQTSPPPEGAGLVRAIARTRGVGPENVLLGAGSSDLIYRALTRWLTPTARVLLLDPTYGEYAYVCECVVGCRVDRLPLARENDYRLDVSALEALLASGDYDLVVVVNPNNPTGQHVPREVLKAAVRQAPARTRVWVDEAYVDYLGAEQSLERFACQTTNVIVCKSLSKAYALSGLRVAYLAGPTPLLEELRTLTPPWVVSLPAQVAAVRVLQEPAYYAACYTATHTLRRQLAERLVQALPRLQIVPGTANYLLCHLPEDGPDATTVVSRCQAHGLFLRDLSCVGSVLGRHAFRIAVKSEQLQPRMVEILHEACLPGGG
jgi:histidinol-phosphate/aromatic aminotransferase/cobyric acid decarboxylase-like protein/N-acyl-L-homoserine lactone synthetase